jgi:hypothetical protein
MDQQRYTFVLLRFKFPLEILSTASYVSSIVFAVSQIILVVVSISFANEVIIPCHIFTNILLQFTTQLILPQFSYSFIIIFHIFFNISPIIEFHQMMLILITININNLL